MRRTRVVLIAGAMCAGWSAAAAHASDKLTVAPAAGWVVPVALPSPPVSADDTPLTVLLRDEQFDLRPGTQARYTESAFRIDKPDGLSAGMIALAWNPDTDTVVVHKLQIKRGDKVIDVLGAGQSFTIVRREANLEKAVLDGQLTATLQPEGLQVGDIIDFAATVSRSDPALGKHVETTGGAWNEIPVARAHLRASWPTDVAMHVRSAGDTTLPAPARRGNMMVVELTRDDVKPVKLPNLAPPRFRYGRLVEFSDYPTWSGVAQLMAPLYTTASAVPAASPLNAEIARIKAASTDPKTRAAAALAVVQDRIRYVFIGINDGGLVPAAADLTWSRRFGDCKGKTALLLALLHGLDITAVPVAVSSRIGDGLDQRLPLVEVFDHVLVRATIDGRDFWLDGTRSGDRTLDGLAIPDFRWGLPLTPSSTRLVAMLPPPLSEPDTDIALQLDATAGATLPAAAHATRILRGDVAVVTNLQLARLSGDARDQALRDFWKEKYAFITVSKVSASFDADRREMTMAMDGTAKMEWNDGFYQTDDTGVGYKADFSRDEGSDKAAPFAVGYPSFVRVRETIKLPTDGFSLYHPEDIDRTVAGVAYRRHAELTGRSFTVEETERSIAPEFSAREAPAAQATLRELSKQALYVKMPAHYAMSDAELTAAMATTPTTADAYIKRGNALLEHQRTDEAIVDLTNAIRLDPHNALALADRGVAHTWKSEKALALADLDAAAAIEPRNTIALNGRAILAQLAGDAKAVIGFTTTALDIDPADDFARRLRATANYQTGQYQAAASDAALIIQNDPRATDTYLMLGNIARRTGDTAGIKRQADSLLAANPKDDYALVVASQLQASYGDKAAGLRTIDRALAITKEAYIYINRAALHASSDYTARLSDLDAALKLEPKNSDALLAKARVLLEMGNPASAATMLAKVSVSDPADNDALLQRGIIRAKLSQQALAEQDFAIVRSRAKTPAALNSLCWAKATANAGLESALADCDAALKLVPDGKTIWGSRAFVLFRLGRQAEAVADYDKALANDPHQAFSLFGRALAEASLGKVDQARRDVADAQTMEPTIRSRFTGYGVSVPAALTVESVGSGKSAKS